MSRARIDAFMAQKKAAAAERMDAVADPTLGGARLDSFAEKNVEATGTGVSHARIDAFMEQKRAAAAKRMAAVAERNTADGSELPGAEDMRRRVTSARSVRPSTAPADTG